MVGRGDGDGVEVLVVQRLAEVLHALGRVAGQLLHHFASRGEQPAVGIDQVGDLDVLHPGESLHVAFAPGR